IRCPEEQHAESLLFCLKTDGHNAAKSLLECKFAEAADGLFLFQSGERVVAKVAETQQSAEASHQADEIIVQAFVLCGAAEFITQPDRDDGRRALRVPVMKKERSSGKPHDTQDPVQGLRKHALNFPADKT